jgi:hypothetical protein
MRRKAEEAVLSIDCDVELGGPVSCWQAALVAQELLKHILFMRNQVPSLMDEMIDKVQVCRPFPVTQSRRSAREWKLACMPACQHLLIHASVPRNRRYRDQRIKCSHYIPATGSRSRKEAGSLPRCFVSCIQVQVLAWSSIVSSQI